MTDAVIEAVWEQVELMRLRRIAHRDLRLANIFLAADGAVWMIDFGFSELAASRTAAAPTTWPSWWHRRRSKIGAERATKLALAAVGPSPGRRPRLGSTLGLERRDPHGAPEGAGIARRTRERPSPGPAARAATALCDGGRPSTSRDGQYKLTVSRLLTENPNPRLVAATTSSTPSATAPGGQSWSSWPSRPRAVGELAAELPVTRPAVSLHLRVLRDAGLVTSTAAGTRGSTAWIPTVSPCCAPTST